MPPSDSSERLPAVGFIGLGNQGAPMARAISAAGLELWVWARRASSLAVLADTPHHACESVEALGGRCDVVSLCVGDDHDVEEILFARGLLDSMRRNSVIANHSTGSPEAAIRAEQRARARGIWFLDAPVSGGSAGAKARTLTMMVGGDAEVLLRCRRVFEACCRTIVHVGPAGAGQLTKLLNNLAFAANLANAADIVRLADAVGLDVRPLLEVVGSSSAGSYAMDALAQQLDSELAVHASALLMKDIAHVADVLRRRGLAETRLEAIALAGLDDLNDAVRILTRASSDERVRG